MRLWLRSQTLRAENEGHEEGVNGEATTWRRAILTQDPTVKAAVSGLGGRLDIISGGKYMSDYYGARATELVKINTVYIRKDKPQSRV